MKNGSGKVFVAYILIPYVLFFVVAMGFNWRSVAYTRGGANRVYVAVPATTKLFFRPWSTELATITKGAVLMEVINQRFDSWTNPQLGYLGDAVSHLVCPVFAQSGADQDFFAANTRITASGTRRPTCYWVDDLNGSMELVTGIAAIRALFEEFEVPPPANRFALAYVPAIAVQAGIAYIFFAILGLLLKASRNRGKEAGGKLKTT